MSTRAHAALLAIILGCTTANAAETGPYDDSLGHDWWGVRSYLLEHGVDLRIGYISEGATNVQGGTHELWRNADQWDISTTLDLQQLLDLPAAQFQISLTKRDGRNLSLDAHLGSLQEVQGIYGRGQTWRWTQLWFDQKYLRDRIDWKIGRLTLTEDFASFSCEFENLTFCASPPGNFDIAYWYNWPISQWGSRLQVTLPEFGYVKLGAYEVDPKDLQIRYGLRLGLPQGATGLLVPVEVGWLPTFGHRLEGSYKLGLWYNSSPAEDVSENSNHQSLSLYGGSPLIHHGQFGGYVNFLQRLTGSSQDSGTGGLRVFANATFTDRRSSALDSQIAMGLFYTGLARSRPRDELGAAIGRTHDAYRLAPLQTLRESLIGPEARLQGSEYVAELFYGVHAMDGVVVRPNVQFIYQPGGIPQTTNDVVVGLMVSVDL